MAQRIDNKSSMPPWPFKLSVTLGSFCEGLGYRVFVGIDMKIFDDIRAKVNGFIDDLAELLGLQPALQPVPVKKNKDNQE